MAHRSPADSARQVQAYLSALPPDARAHLRKLRDIIRSVAPNAVEEIAYGMPAYRLEGRVFIYYAAWIGSSDSEWLS